MIYYLGFRADSIGIIQGIALIVGMLSVVPASKILSKHKFVLATSIAVLLSFVGVVIVEICIRDRYFYSHYMLSESEDINNGE